MALTLNQVVRRIKTLALSHQQINTFYSGDNFEADAGADIVYPICVCEKVPGSIDRAQKLTTYNFRLYFLDRVLIAEDSEGNEDEVLSDMASVANDMMAMLMYSGYEDDWIIGDLAVHQSVTEVLNDMVSGSVLDVSVSVDFIADRCQVPADDVTFETDIDMARTKLITYTGTGVEGDSFTVAGIAGSYVLAAYRAGQYRRCITTVPVVSEKIQVAGTDGGSKGILSSTGVVSLQSGDALLVDEILDFLIYV